MTQSTESRLLALLLLGLAALLPRFQPMLGGEPAPKPAEVHGPLSPPEALKHFHLDPGLRIELVAAEPEIESPVAMAFDEDGKLWVVEMGDYPNGPAPGKPAEGRIKVLEDRDGDGRYETSRVFADELLFANGLLPWRGGVIVTAAPYIMYLRDTDGDGKADRREILFEGFATKNPQLRVSHPVLGIDGWVYVANGLRGGEVIRSGKKEKPINLSGMDFRFDLVHDRYEAISGMGQYGNTFDDWGNRFVCDNNHHLRHVVLPNRYIKRNPFLAVPAVLEDISQLEAGPLNSGGKIYPLSKNWTTSSLHEGRFTAACGVFIYRGDLLPEPYRGAAFTCDPTGDLVHMEVMQPHGATFRSKPARDGVEFLASPDDWFRPVFLSHGHDGALYVVDMYRAVIEHPEFMPAELKNRPDLTRGKDKGRIWRIVPEKAHAKTQRPQLSKASTQELVDLLAHPNAWWRTTAQRLLLERNDRAAIEPLRKALASKEPLARLHAAWLLNSFDALDEDTVVQLLKDGHPRVREHAVVLAERWLPTSGPVQAAVAALDFDADPRVRFQVALSVGESDDDFVWVPLTHIAKLDVEDRWTRMAIASSVPKHAGTMGAVFLKKSAGLAKPATQGQLLLFRDLATLVGARRDADEVADFVQRLISLETPDASRWQMAGLNGLADGMGRRGTQLGAFLKALPESGKDLVAKTDALLSQTASLATDGKRDQGDRLQAVRLLAHVQWQTAEPVLTRLLTDDPAQDIRLAAVRALAAHPQPEVATLLMKGWKSYTPAVRREVTEAMLRQPDRIQFLLNEVEAGRVKPGDIDALRTRQLVNHNKPEIRDRARKLLQENLPEERKLVLERYKTSLSLKGDAKRGRDVFQKNCATCHRVAGVGIDVGPDIGDTRTKTPDALMSDVLNPNQAIDANYINYSVFTKGGKVFTGVIAAETASSITLRRAENQTDVVLRQDIEDMQSTGLSLMPEALEKNISVEEMADLLNFLKNWRYLDGAVPLGELGEQGKADAIKVQELDDHLLIETDALQARINKKGYVSGTAAGSFIDKKTGARDAGFGLHIMDFLLAPGWRDDGYPRDVKLHGNLPKHYVEGPQICTQAKKLDPEVIRGDGFVAVRLRFTFTQPAQGFKAGSQWVQTLVFQPGLRYCLCSEQITCVNDVDDLFYRIDMPGHIKHKQGDTFEKVYLSYEGEIPAAAFEKDFGPDEKHLYQRKDDKVPERIIRAYQVKVEGKPGPWLAGMTLDPKAVCEAWCHQRGYVCMIQELHRRKVKAGETFGAAYVVGWFDGIAEMEKTYDQYKGANAIVLEGDKFRLR